MDSVSLEAQVKWFKDWKAWQREREREGWREGEGMNEGKKGGNVGRSSWITVMTPCPALVPQFCPKAQDLKCLELMFRVVWR